MRSRRNRQMPAWWNDPAESRDTRQQIRRNNFIAILIILLIFMFETNLGGCATKLGRLISGF